MSDICKGTLSDTAFKILEKERMDVVNWLKELQGRV